MASAAQRRARATFVRRFARKAKTKTKASSKPRVLARHRGYTATQTRSQHAGGVIDLTQVPGASFVVRRKLGLYVTHIYDASGRAIFNVKTGLRRPRIKT